MNVISLLPYLVEHFEEPNTVCSEVAEHIAQVRRLLFTHKHTHTHTRARARKLSALHMQASVASGHNRTEKKKQKKDEKSRDV